MAAEKKCVLITGCSPGGIGNALAREYHSNGLRVFATARKAEDITDLSGLGIETFSLDVCDQESIAAAKEVISKNSGGRLDILVNNAGRTYACPAVELNFAEVHQTFETNIISVMRMVQVFSPMLMKAEGTVVNIGTVNPNLPFAFRAIYNATKGALQAYSNVLRVEMAPFNVKVFLVRTGAVVSRIARTKRALLPSSAYYPINDKFEHQIRISQTGAMDTAAYAKAVVAKSIGGGDKREMVIGGKFWLIWFLSYCVPAFAADLVASKMFALDKLAKLQSERRKGLGDGSELHLD